MCLFYSKCFGLNFYSALSTTSSIRFCRVSCCLARTIQLNIIFLVYLLKLRKWSFEPLYFSNAISKSSGIINSSTSSKIVKCPFCFAVSMQPSLLRSLKLDIRFAAFSLLIFDQLLLGLRLLKNCINKNLPIAFLVLSILPKQSAPSTASLQLIEGILDFFQ